jgi:hypothetical protein
MRLCVTFVIGLMLAIGGVFLRLNAHSMTKPPQSASWAPGNWEATEWAFWQHAWSDLGNLAFLVVSHYRCTALICRHSALTRIRRFPRDSQACNGSGTPPPFWAAYLSSLWHSTIG